VIIACPECGARYRLPGDTVAENARMRCAACDYRWVVEAPAIDPVPAPAPPEAAAPAPDIAESPLVVPAPAPETAPEPAPDPAASPQSSLVRTLVAVAVGGALALAAGALWLKRVDPAQLPVIGDQLAQLSRPAVPLGVAFTAQTSVLPSGERLLEINGRVTNTGTAPVAVPPLEARLAGPGGTVRRWRIAVPVSNLDPGRSAAFASTATDFPADATIVAIRPGR
jgi:predicted Zn finger-like uncharacterized protein